MKIKKTNTRGIVLQNRARIRNIPHFKIGNEQINDSKVNKRIILLKKCFFTKTWAVASFSNIIENNYR